MSRWFRFYDDAVNDPKIQRLDGERFKAWVNLLCIASKNDGALPSLCDLAFLLRKSEVEVSNLLDDFCQSGLLDPLEMPDAPMSYEPHNWRERQFKSDKSDPTNAKRQQTFRDKHRKPDVKAPLPDRYDAVTVTATRTDTDTEQNRKKETREAALSFELFWAQWPNKVGKPAAEKAFRSAMKRGADVSQIIDGVRRYVRARPDDRPWLNPATFLNQNRWEDQPAKVQHGKVQADNPKAGSLIGAINRAIEEIEAEPDLALPADNILCLPNRSVQRS